MSRKKKYMLGSVIVLGAMIYGVYVVLVDATKSSPQSDTPDAIAVRTVTAQNAQELSHTIVRRGIVVAQNEVHLAPKISGRVTNLYVDIGDHVSKGQRLARIDGAEVWAQTRVAQQGRDGAQEIVTETKDYFDEQVSMAKKARALAKDAYEDAKKHGDKKTVAELKAKYVMAKTAYDVALAGRDLQIDRARTQRDLADQQFIAAQTLAANTIVRAPFDGVIGARNVDVGALVAPEVPMFVVVAPAKKHIDLPLAVTEIAQVAVGDSVNVIRADGTEGSGTISVISPMIDTQTRKGLVRVTLEDPASYVLGEYVDVQLKTTIKNATDDALVVIPREALVPLYHDMQVYVVRDGSVHAQIVTLGNDYGRVVGITDGLHIGDVVVVEGQYDIHDGDRVRIIK